MTFLSLEPFIPSGKNFEKAKQLFQEIGFEIDWEEDGIAGFVKDDCKFILQNYDNQTFAENLMLSVKVKDVNKFWEDINKKKLPEKYGIPSISPPINQPYGRELNIIDIAGICWHFIENTI